jgi:hypothetical protein
VWLEDSLRRGAKTTGKSPTNQLPPQVRDRPGDQLAAAPSARSKKVPHRPRGEKCGLAPNEESIDFEASKSKMKWRMFGRLRTFKAYGLASCLSDRSSEEVTTVKLFWFVVALVSLFVLVRGYPETNCGKTRDSWRQHSGSKTTLAGISWAAPLRS